jgi:hypothetical protein
MTKIRIKITKEILYKSRFCGFLDQKEIFTNCAISVAVRDIWPNAQVMMDSIIFDPQINAYAKLPLETTFYLTMFDCASVFERNNLPEHEFEIEVPDTVINSINIDEIKKLLENHPNLSIV